MRFNPLIPKGAAPPMAPYSPGVLAGDTIYVSGQLAMDGMGNLVGGSDPRAQTKQVLESIKAILEAADATLEDIAYNMIFIKNTDVYAPMNEIYREYFPSNPPARFCIISELVRPEYLVEITSIAHRQKNLTR